MTNHSVIFLAVVIVIVLVLGFPCSTASGEVQDDDRHSSSRRKRIDGYMPSLTDSSTRLRTIHEGARISLGRNSIENKDSIMFLPLFEDHEQSRQSKDNTQTLINLNSKESIQSTVSPKLAQRSTEATTTITAVTVVKTDKSVYYDAETIIVTYDAESLGKICDESTNTQCWSAVFPAGVMDYSQPFFTYATFLTPGYAYVPTTFLPAVNATYKAVLAVANSDPLHVLGVSEEFRVLSNSAALAVDQSQYYEGQKIVVSYTMNTKPDNVENGFAWIALFAHNVSDYTLSPIKMQFLTWPSSTSTRFSSRNLPALDTKYKAVMAISYSKPLRILAVSNTFTVLPNSAHLTTDKSQYSEGTFVYVSYTLPSTVKNVEKGFAWVALFPQNVHNYSVLPVARSPSSSSKTSDIIAVSTVNLPMLNTTYKAVMGITDSKPPHILGISQPFLVVPPKWHPPDKTSAKWNFKDIQAVFVGNDLMRCEGLANIAPANRSKCSQRKTCFFGNQNCTAVGAFPATRCSCRGTGSKKTWSCKLAVCPKSKNDPII